MKIINSSSEGKGRISMVLKGSLKFPMAFSEFTQKKGQDGESKFSSFRILQPTH
jgi:hypothetical protein